MEEQMTDKQYATILVDELAELDEQIETAKAEGAVKTVKSLQKTRSRKQEKLDIILNKH